MTLQHEMVGDVAANVQLLGRPADMFPHASEAVWQLSPTCPIYVVHDSGRAGGGLVTLARDDLDADERRMREAGLAFDEQIDGSAPRRLVVRDVDGNTLKFSQDPAQPGV
jgi:catechol 2,3-dioxygenase-like lactoylglutathione lyase family enzyme